MKNCILLIFSFTFLLGVDFLPNVAVTDVSGTQKMPDLDVGNDGTIYVVWFDQRSGKNIYFAKSVDHGQTFIGETQVNDVNGKAVSLDPSSPKIAEHDGTLYVVWPDERDGYSLTNIYLSKSTDGGETWSEGVQVGSVNKFNLYPEIKTDTDGNIHLIYYRYNSFSLEFEAVQYRLSSDGGESFSSPSTVNNYSGSFPCECCPADIIFLNDGTKLSAFRDNNNNIRDMYGIFSPSGSNYWDGLFQISYDDYFITFCPASGPSLANFNTTVAVSYMAGVNQAPKVFLKVSTDNGLSFGDSIAVDPSAVSGNNQDYPSTVVTPDEEVHVVWQDQRGGYDIYYGSLSAGSNAVGNIQVVNDDTSSNRQYTPRMVSDENGFLYVVWQDQRDGTEIYFTTNYSDSMSINLHPLIPHQIKMHQNYPNPFNPVTTFRYFLPENSLVRITIYDMLGRQVRTLINTTQFVGYKTVIWDGINDSGNPVSAGVYFYTIQIGNITQTNKMVLLK